MLRVMAQFTFRRVTRGDFALLGGWLAQPHVHRWWQHDPSPEAVARDFGAAADGAEPSSDWLILADRQPIGMVQFCYLHDYPDYLDEIVPITPVPQGTGTIDYLIGEPELVGKGVGTRAITAFISQHWDREPNLTGLLVPVVSVNPASWRMLQRVGFTRLTSGEMKPDNPTDPPLHHLMHLARPT